MTAPAMVMLHNERPSPADVPAACVLRSIDFVELEGWGVHHIWQSLIVTVPALQQSETS